jgi:hypothetical protein
MQKITIIREGFLMALLIRLAGRIVRLIFSFLTALLLMILRLLLPATLVVLGWLFSLLTTALVATVNGPRQSVESMASDWTRRLIAFGVSREHLDIAYRLCRFLATLVILLGWLLAAFFAVAFGRIVFGILT